MRCKKYIFSTTVLNYATIKYMNKDVIYIEPEDDITSIIRKINASTHKLIALVPPKRIGVLRSAVNTRLIAKNAKKINKTVVIVSTDKSLAKLAAAANIPVADTLQSRPKLPSEILDTPATEAIPSEITINENKDVVDKPVAAPADAPKPTATPKKGPRPVKDVPKAVDDEINSIELEAEAEADKTEESKSTKKVLPDMDQYKKWIIIGSVAGVLLIVFLVWAFVFAPFTKIMVAIRTTSNNFSENVSFVTKTDKENASEGVFYLEQQTYEAVNSVEFTATGEKDVSEKATGTLTLVATVSSNSPITLTAGSVFTRSSLNYTLDKEVTFSVKNQSEENCTDPVADYTSGTSSYTCTVSAKVPITAEKAGDEYNTASASTGWTTKVSSNIKVQDGAASGGVSKVIKIVQQSDIDTAKAKLQQSTESTDKEKLTAKFASDIYKIETSYSVDAKDPVASPKVGEEVKDGVKPKLTQTTTYKMFGVDSNKLNQFIKQKTEEMLASDQKLYEVGAAFLENFRETDGTYSARLKATTQSGPSVTEEEIMNKSLGRKIGEVQSLIKSINGVSSVKIDASFFWVNSVPNDPNKVEIELKVEE